MILLSGLLLSWQFLWAETWINDEKWMSAAEKSSYALGQLQFGSFGTLIPAALIRLSLFMAPNSIWAVHIWSALALIGLGLSVRTLADRLLEREQRIHKCVPLFAGLAVMAHPLTGLTGSENVYLGGQLATLGSIWLALSVISLMDRPRVSMLWKMAALLLFVSLCMPGGFLLGAATAAIVAMFRPHASRKATGLWLGMTFKQHWVMTAVLGLELCGLILMLKVGWEAHTNQSSLSWTTHWLSQGRACWLALRSLLAPFGLLPSHVVPFSESWKDWVAVSGLAALVMFGIWSWRQRNIVSRPSLKLVASLILLALLPTFLRMFWLSPVVFTEARLYPTLPWIALLTGLGLGWIIRHLRLLGLVLAGAIPCALGLIALPQLQTARDAEQRCHLVLAREPQNFEIRKYLQQLQADSGNLAGVLQTSKATEAIYRSLADYNEQNPTHRRYDLLNALRWWVKGERLVLDALKKNYGDTYGQAFATQSAARLKSEVERLSEMQPEAIPLLAQLEAQEVSTPSPTVEAPPSLNERVPSEQLPISRRVEAALK